MAMPTCVGAQITRNHSADYSDITLQKPAGIAAGDLLVAVLMTGATGPQPQIDGGWTLLFDYNTNDGAGNVRAVGWYKTATSSEPTSYYIHPHLTMDKIGTVMAFRGHNPSDPFVAYASALKAGVNDPGRLAPSINMTSKGLLACFWTLSHEYGAGMDGTAMYPPASMTEIAEIWQASYTGNVSVEARSSTGNTGTRSIYLANDAVFDNREGHVSIGIRAGNDAPNVPTLNAPSGTLNNAAPTLNATVTDPDGGNVQAYFEVSTTSNFSNIVFSGLGSTVTSGTASTLKSSGLNPSTTYYWRARGYDGQAYGGYSTTASFTTSAPIVATFNYTGGAQTFTVPAGITSLTLECWGAQGGGGGGGQGGYAKGTIAVTSGETLSLYVGGRGGPTSWYAYPFTGTGGFNGGGDGNVGGGDNGSGNPNGAGGGGASDVRRGGTALANRVLVGAGGGGVDGNEAAAGSGGASTGGSAGTQHSGKGGTQSAGGAGGIADSNMSSDSGLAGSLGVGGRAGQGYGGNSYPAGGGGGGGGYYGGGGGAAPTHTNVYGPGGGGSNLVTGSAQTSTQGGRTGDGLVVISYVNTTETANAAPTAPTLTTADNIAKPLRGGGQFTWTHNDPNGHAQGSYAFRRTRDGVNEWWNGNTWINAETFVGVATQSVTFPGGVWPPGKYTWTVATTDSFGAPGPYATARTVTVPGGLSMIV